MNSFETLRSELNTQKNIISSLGGTVTVASDHTYPTPSEITAGLNTLSIPNTSSATASPTDVLEGKTFFAGDNSIKFGTLQAISIDDLNKIFLYTPSSTPVSFDFPPTTKIRPYLFYMYPNSLTVTLPTDVEEVCEHAFDLSYAYINNLPELTKLTTLGMAAFNTTKNIDLSALPSSLTTFGNKSFWDTTVTSSTITIPPLVTKIPIQCFGRYNDKIHFTNFNFNGAKVLSFGQQAMQNLVFDCDFTLPASTTTIGVKCFYGGSVKNLTLPSTFTNLGSSSFNGPTDDPAETYNLQSVTFERVTPPTFGTNIFHPHHLNKGLKIYVPDNSYEAYKTAKNFSIYANYIYRVSEKTT